MIVESHFWKNELLKQALNLRKRTTQKRWTEVSYARFEQTLMLGFYSIRKLIEAKKLSNETMSENYSLTTFPWSGNNVTRINWHKIDELHEFDSEINESRDLLFICHQFVHSYVFMATFNNCKALGGVFFASDRQRHKSLLHISIDQVIALFEQVGNDYPNSFSLLFNSKKGDFDVESTMT